MNDPAPAVAGPPAVSTVELESGYGASTVLRGVSVTVRDGGVTALIGPNGAGKTTLLKTMAGLLKPTKGQVLLAGADVTSLRPEQRVRSGLCLIPEGRAVYRNLTVRENLQMQAPKRRVGHAIERATAAFPVLGQRLSQTAGTLSGGEQQMLALCSAYVREPRVILVDEASLGLAPIVVDVVFEFLETLAREQVALLLVDQFAHRALRMAAHAYVLRRGEIAYDGPPTGLLDGKTFERYIGVGVG